MVLSNPTHSIDANVFQAVYSLCEGILSKANKIDLYYVANYINKSFSNWSAQSDLSYFVIVTETRCHLLNDLASFTIKRRMYLTQSDSPFVCSQIDIVRSVNGWEIRVNRLDNKSGQVIS